MLQDSKHLYTDMSIIKSEQYNLFLYHYRGINIIFCIFVLLKSKKRTQRVVNIDNLIYTSIQLTFYSSYTEYRNKYFYNKNNKHKDHCIYNGKNDFCE